MSITMRQAEDLLAENYSPVWSHEDPDWWQDMTEQLMEYRSVRHLRRAQPEMAWRIPRQWPGADKDPNRAPAS